ncbi:hypothetical protein [Parashewanella tropica]|uniref:hypothetical protein n=1 Tax=Parashewanella tropica TaxID=2547970 RepID=UPI00105A41C2|nr:hypothetical protein [Parashewanella tropica]
MSAASKPLTHIQNLFKNLQSGRFSFAARSPHSQSPSTDAEGDGSLGEFNHTQYKANANSAQCEDSAASASHFHEPHKTPSFSCREAKPVASKAQPVRTDWLLKRVSQCPPTKVVSHCEEPELSLSTIKFLHEQLPMDDPVFKQIAAGDIEAFATTLFDDEGGEVVKKMRSHHWHIGVEDLVEKYIQRWLTHDEFISIRNWSHFILAVERGRNTVLANQVKQYLALCSQPMAEVRTQVDAAKPASCYQGKLAEKINLLSLMRERSSTTYRLYVQLTILSDEQLFSFGEELFPENGDLMVQEALIQCQKDRGDGKDIFKELFLSWIKDDISEDKSWGRFLDIVESFIHKERHTFGENKAVKMLGYCAVIKAEKSGVVSPKSKLSPIVVTAKMSPPKVFYVGELEKALTIMCLKGARGEASGSLYDWLCGLNVEQLKSLGEELFSEHGEENIEVIVASHRRRQEKRENVVDDIFKLWINNECSEDKSWGKCLDIIEGFIEKEKRRHGLEQQEATEMLDHCKTIKMRYGGSDADKARKRFSWYQAHKPMLDSKPTMDEIIGFPYAEETLIDGDFNFVDLFAQFPISELEQLCNELTGSCAAMTAFQAKSEKDAVCFVTELIQLWLDNTPSASWKQLFDIFDECRPKIGSPILTGGLCMKIHQARYSLTTNSKP